MNKTSHNDRSADLTITSHEAFNVRNFSHSNDNFADESSVHHSERLDRHSDQVSNNDNVLRPVGTARSSASSVSSELSRVTSISQHEIQKLISIHVHQELSKYPSLRDDEKNPDNIVQYKTLKKWRAKAIKHLSKIDSYPPFKQIGSYQKWYEAKAKHNKLMEIVGSAGYFSLLYPFIIAGIVLGNVKGDHPILTFVFNILAIIPLSVIISYLTEALTELTNPTIGGLLNITFGNAIELIFSIMALFKGQLDTVQGSMVGSWLATTMLILGGAFFFASFNKKQISFNKLSCYFNIIFLVYSGMVVKLISSVNYNSNYTKKFTNSSSSSPSDAIVKISNGLAVLHLILYFVYLFIPYQHKRLLASYNFGAHKDEESVLDDASSMSEMPSMVRFASRNRFEQGEFDTMYSNTLISGNPTAEASKVSVANATSTVDSHTALPSVDNVADIEKISVAGSSAVSVQSKWRTSKWTRIRDIAIYSFCLVGVTVISSFNSDYLLDSLDDFSEVAHISKPFITVILIPIFSNAAEHVTSIVVACKGQMELALNIAVGSAIQINYLIVPFLILIANATKSKYTFLYETAYADSIFVASLMASFCIWNGRAYFQTGSTLLMLYITAALMIYFM